MAPQKNTEACRLCGGQVTALFEKIVLDRHHVNYFGCKSCGSQQTDDPTWLDEAYAIPGLHIDVGAPTRSIKNWLAAMTLLDLLDIPPGAKGVDFGAGSGLFSRLMRSCGRNFLAQDKFSVPLFMNYFTVDDVANAKPEVITAFEVFEHLPSPKATLENLLSAGAPLVLFTTWLVDGQPEDWIYYLPECGQHVFFYSDKGLRELALAHGYRMQVCQYFYVLSHPGQLTLRQLATVDDFCLHSIERVKSRIPDLLGGVIMGNEHIDHDFVLASAEFKERLGASKSKRSHPGSKRGRKRVADRS